MKRRHRQHAAREPEQKDLTDDGSQPLGTSRGGEGGAEKKSSGKKGEGRVWAAVFTL